MKIIAGFFLGALSLLSLIYLVFAIGNGNFNFAVWSEQARTGFALAGIFSIIVGGFLGSIACDN